MNPTLPDPANLSLDWMTAGDLIIAFCVVVSLPLMTYLFSILLNERRSNSRRR